MNKRIVGIFNVEDFLERHSIHCWMVDRPLFDSGNFTWNSVFAKWSFENTTMKFERETRLRKFAERRKIFRSSVSSSFFFFSFSCFLSLSLSLFYGQRKIHFRKRLPPGYPGYFSLGGNWIFVVFLRPWIFFFFFFSTYNHSYNWTYNTRRRSSDGTVRTTNTPSTPLPPTMEKARDKLTVRMNKIFSQSLSLLKNFLTPHV